MIEIDQEAIGDQLATRIAEFTAWAIRIGIAPETLLQAYEQHVEELRARIGRAPG